MPVSETRSRANPNRFSPGASPVGSSCRIARVAIDRWPPSGIASRALAARFISTCSICPTSANTMRSRAASVVERSMSSPIRRRNRRSTLRTTSFRSIGLGLMICFRLNANSPRVSCAARSDAVSISLKGDLVRICGRQLQLDQVRKSGDPREDVVEVVCHTASQGADGLHLLCMSKLVFELVSPGDVAHGFDRRVDRSR